MRDIEEFFQVRLRPDEADIRVAGASYLLLRREAYCGLSRELRETLGRGADGIFYRAGLDRGQEFHATATRFLGSRDPEAVVEAGRLLAPRLGLYRVVSFRLEPEPRASWTEWVLTPAATARVVVERSFEVCPVHPSGAPTCHYIRGFWAGLVQEMFGQGESVVGREVECESTGAHRCSFAFSLAPVL